MLFHLLFRNGIIFRRKEQRQQNFWLSLKLNYFQLHFILFKALQKAVCFIFIVINFLKFYVNENLAIKGPRAHTQFRRPIYVSVYSVTPIYIVYIHFRICMLLLLLLFWYYYYCYYYYYYYKTAFCQHNHMNSSVIQKYNIYLSRQVHGVKGDLTSSYVRHILA